MFDSSGFTMTSYYDYVIVDVTPRYVHVRLLWPFFSLSVMTRCGHFMKSTCDFSVKIITFVTIVRGVGRPDFTQIQSEMFESTFFTTGFRNLGRFFTHSCNQILPGFEIQFYSWLQFCDISDNSASGRVVRFYLNPICKIRIGVFFFLATYSVWIRNQIT